MQILSLQNVWSGRFFTQTVWKQRRDRCSLSASENHSKTLERVEKFTLDTADYTKYINKENAKIAVGVSGGVDSAITTLLLKKGGYNIEGFFMINWDSANDEFETKHSSKTSTCHEKDEKDAEEVCKKLQVKIQRATFIKEYWSEVWESVLADYEKGFTPNPDVLCNQFIKANRFLRYVTERGFTHVATGHYARKRRVTVQNPIDLSFSEEWQLLRANDKKKDQSYFLCTLTQFQLDKMIFPVGELLKADVKAMADQNGLENVLAKKESMGVCFIGKKKGAFRHFLSQYLHESPGDIFFIGSNDVVGRHSGLFEYTVGQRVRLFHSTTESVYCVKKDYKKNAIYVAEGYFHPALTSTGLFAANISFISGYPPHALLNGDELKCEAKVRYSSPLLKCSVRISNHKELAEVSPDHYPLGDDTTLYHVQFERPVQAIAPGQYVVLYQGDVCLGGGKIVESSKLLN